MKIIAYTDGATWKTNPGPAGLGVAFYRPDETEPFDTLCLPFGFHSNNEAEYQAVIEAIEYWILDIAHDGETRRRELEIRCDSKLVVEQVNNRYKMKAKNLRAYLASIKWLRQLVRKAGGRVTIVHIPRTENAVADAISKAAADLSNDQAGDDGS